MPILPQFFDKEVKLTKHGRAYVQYNDVERSQKFREELSHAMALPLRVKGAHLYPAQHWRVHGHSETTRYLTTSMKDLLWIVNESVKKRREMKDYVRDEFRTLDAYDIMGVLANEVYDASGKVHIRYEIAVATWMTSQCGMLNPNAEIRIRALHGSQLCDAGKIAPLPEGV